MAAVNFFLKRPSESTSAIVCTLSDGRDYRIKLYPGVGVNPRHWSKRNANVLSADLDAVSKNKFLKDFRSKVYGIYLEAKSKGILPDREYFQRELEPVQENKTAFWDIWEKYLASRQGIFKKHSFAKFGSLKAHLVAFEKTLKKPLELDTVSVETLENLQGFFYSSQGLNTQSSQKYIGLFKMLLSWAFLKKHTANADFKNFKPIRQPDSLKATMTGEDLDKLHSVDLGALDYLKNVRALFLLACGTGLRYSDFSRVNKQHLKKNDGGHILQMRQTKTGDFVSIPLTVETLQIVRDLIDGKIHSISNQRMNSYVKELCQKAGIDEPFDVDRFVGNEKTTLTVPKYELVSTHTGRRTFATSLLEKGVPAEVVMRFTGHRDYKSFSKYVNVPKRSQMEMVRNALEHKPKMWKAS